MRASFRIVFAYAVTASLWIILSDKAIALLTADPASLTWLATVKGLIFVSITSTLLFLLIRRELAGKSAMIESLRNSVKAREDLVNELHHRIKNNLQILKSIITIEAENSATKEILVSTVMDEIHAIGAVFEIVYEKSTMSKLPLREIFRKFTAYKRMKLKDREVLVEIGENPEFDLETATSIVLLLNVVIDAMQASSPERSVILLTIPDNRAILVSCEGFRCEECLAAVMENPLVEAYLRMLNGRITAEEETLSISLSGNLSK